MRRARSALAVVICALTLVTAGSAARAQGAPKGPRDDLGEPPRELSASASEGEQARRFRWYLIPNIAYDTDDGLGFGLRGELAIPEQGYEPYRVSYVLHAFASLRNYHHHRFRFDRVGLGRHHRLRLTVHAAYRQWGNDGYWGIGDGTVREREYVGDFDRDDPRRKRYRYTLIQPFIHTTLQADMGNDLALFLSINGKWTVVRTYAGSLLAEQVAEDDEREAAGLPRRIHGLEGGLTILLSAGLVYDTRQPEVEPERGVLAEVSGEWALPLPWGPGQFGGAFFSLRVYRALTRWLTLAGRVMAELLAGEVPFYEMVHWRGSVPVAGFGGFETLRGVSFGRWRAPGKAILNLELRFRLGEHRLFRHPFVWQLGLFGDGGVVWGAGDAATAPELDFPLHLTGGLGVRVVYDRSFVGRVDFGLSNDPVVELDGSVSRSLQYGIYVVFDQAF